MIRAALHLAWPGTRPIAKLGLILLLGSATTLSDNGGKK